MKFSQRAICVLVLAALCVSAAPAHAGVLHAGGDATVTDLGGGASNVIENGREPESPNIRLTVPTLEDDGGSVPNSIRIISVTGGILQQGNGSAITLGASGTILVLSSGHEDFRFTPTANRKTDANFSYAVVDPDNTANNSDPSVATIPIEENDVAPILKTASGSTGTGLAATFYTSSYDLTGPSVNTLDSTVNFNTSLGGTTTVWGVPNVNADNFSVRWTGQVKAPVDGNYTFTTISDDGIRVWIDGTLVIDNYTTHAPATNNSPAIAFAAGSLHDIEINYYERGGGEEMVLEWSYPGQGTQVIPQSALFPGTTRPALSYVNGSPSAVVDDAVSVTDADDADLSGATVAISANYQSSEDSLLFTNQNGITGSYSSGTLTLSGSATVANYQAALRSVRYANSNTSPNTSTRTVEFTVTDGEADSNSTFRNITFSATNHPPVIAEGSSVSVEMDENADPTPFALTLDATDPDFQSITWSVSSPASHGTASVDETGDSVSVSYDPDADYAGPDSFAIQASDGAGGTDTITVDVDVRDNIAPEISNIVVTPASSSAAIAWETDEDSSSQVLFSADESYASSTSETDVSPRISAHSEVVSGLLPCTLYHYKVRSRDSSGNTANSSSSSFITSGCPADSTPDSPSVASDAVDAAAGGTVTSGDEGRTLTVVAPENFTAASSSVVIQIKGMPSDPVLRSIGRPGRTLRSAAGIVFYVTALVDDVTVLDSFDAPVTITYAYTDGDVAGLDEASLRMYHYHDGAWIGLDDCTVDADANTITCSAPSFSTFAIFGSPLDSGDSRHSGGSVQEQVFSLLSAGRIAEAEAVKKQWYWLFPDDVQAAAPAPAQVRDLKLGMSGEDVRSLQKLLNAGGFALGGSGAGAPGSETDYFGSRTRAALASYQKSKGVAPSAGYFGPLTRASMKSLNLAGTWW